MLLCKFVDAKLWALAAMIRDDWLITTTTTQINECLTAISLLSTPNHVNVVCVAVTNMLDGKVAIFTHTSSKKKKSHSFRVRIYSRLICEHFWKCLEKCISPEM